MAGQTYTRTFVDKDSGVETEVEFEVDSWGSAPQTWGPPESCDPGEGMEAHIVRATVDGAEVKLTDEQAERYETAFLEDPPEVDYADDIEWDAP